MFIGGSGDAFPLGLMGGNSLVLESSLPDFLEDVTILGSMDLTTSQWLFFRCTLMGSSFALVSLTTGGLPPFRGAIDELTSQYVSHVPLPFNVN